MYNSFTVEYVVVPTFTCVCLFENKDNQLNFELFVIRTDASLGESCRIYVATCLVELGMMFGVNVV